MTQQPNHPWEPWETAPKTAGVFLASNAEGEVYPAAYAIWLPVGIDRWIRIDQPHPDGAVTEPPPHVFWREMPPGPYGEPENAKLLAACKILHKVLMSGPQTITQSEIDQIQAALDAEESHD